VPVLVVRRGSRAAVGEDVGVLVAVCELVGMGVGEGADV
jgi:hypothetical protein